MPPGASLKTKSETAYHRLKRYLSMLMPRLWVSNWRAYNAKDVAEEYAAQTHLQKPEQSVLNLVADSLKNWRMLDIGVGGGQTTYHFAPIVEEYIGIDYAEKMIEACQRKSRSGPRNVSFKLCDATDMSMFRMLISTSSSRALTASIIWLTTTGSKH